MPKFVWKRPPVECEPEIKSYSGENSVRVLIIYKLIQDNYIVEKHFKILFLMIHLEISDEVVIKGRDYKTNINSRVPISNTRRSPKVSKYF